MPVSGKTIGRLSVYRRLLDHLAQEGMTHVYSHQMAEMLKFTAAQVRRDLMTVGCRGNPSRGYEIHQLQESLGKLLDAPDCARVALVGVGNLGRALLAFFAGRRARLQVVAAFDRDLSNCSQVLQGCPCYLMTQLADVIARENIRVGIIAVPVAAAQSVADQLVAAGVTGLLNFAPVPLQVPGEVFVESIDLTMSLEKAAYFARQSKPSRRTKPS